jgi:chromosome partitioning protein
MQIALVQKKGGSGKTTLCILLHETIRQTGQRVAVRDYDAQGSATKALSRFGGTAEVPGEKYDVLLIDTPPSLTMTATAAAVNAADIILIPTSPPLRTFGKQQKAPYSFRIKTNVRWSGSR